MEDNFAYANVLSTIWLSEQQSFLLFEEAIIYHLFTRGHPDEISLKLDEMLWVLPFLLSLVSLSRF